MAASPLPLSARPVRCRKSSVPLPQRYNFATEMLMRLAVLAGLTCPNCGEDLVFDGKRLRHDYSTDCTYAWRDADAAESDIYFGLA